MLCIVRAKDTKVVDMKLKGVRKLMTLAQPPGLTGTPLLVNPRSPSAFSLRMSSTNSLNQTQSAMINSDATVSTSDLEHIFKQKKIIRSNVRKSLKQMDPSLRSLQDDTIQRIVLEAPWFKSSKALCAYISCHALREVDTSKVLADILQTSAKGDQNSSRKKLYVPRVEDKNSHMRMLHISGLDDLIANSMDIFEPAPVDSEGNQREDVMQANEPVDLFLLPGLAFDKSGRRLGRGGGYYDTLLRKYRQLANERSWKQPLLVALSYSVQILDDEVIPITENDVYIDALVSPAGVIPISSTALQRLA